MALRALYFFGPARGGAILAPAFQFQKLLSQTIHLAPDLCNLIKPAIVESFFQVLGEFVQFRLDQVLLPVYLKALRTGYTETLIVQNGRQGHDQTNYHRP
jgi:hypothetical protein